MAEHNVIFELFYDGVWNRAPVLTRASVSYRRGQQGAGAEMDPARAALTLDRGDIYAPKSATSPLRGKIGQNTPGRLTADGSVRMLGEVSSWKPVRPIRGTPYTVIELSGVLRRIGRGNDPLHSPLYRAVYALNPVAYWAMEEGRDATELSSVVTGRPPLTYTGVTFAADDSLSGSLALPQLAASGSVYGALTAADYAAGTWEVEWVVYMPAVPAATTTFMQVDTPGGSVARWVFYIDSAFANVYGGIGYGPTGVTVVSWSSTAAISLTGQWLKMRFSAKQNGGNVDARFVYLPADTYGATGGTHNESYAGTAGTPAGMSIPAAAGVAGWSVGHWASFTTYDISSSDGASGGWPGENAAVRFGRLMTEQGISRVIVGDQPSSVLMGVQRPLPLLDLLEETANTDDGTVFEDRGVLGLTLRLGGSKQNQTPALTVSYLGHITPDLEPVLGDAGIRNDVTARNPDGSTRRAVQATGPRNVQPPSDDPQGVGRYQTSAEVNTFTSADLADAAGWRINLGTYDGTWYAEVTVDLDAAPGLTTAVNAVDIGDMIGISELPAEEAIDTVYGIVAGISEELPAKRRLVTFYLVPADPYRTGKLAQTSGDTDPYVGYVDTDGSTTAATVAPGAASFTVATPGTLWTTVADDFPQDVVVGGQRVGVSGIVNYLNANPYFEVDASSWTPVNGAAAVRSTAQFHEGAASLLITPNGTSSVPQAQSDEVTAVAGRSYTISGWLRSTTAATRRLGLFWFDASHTFISANEISQALSAGVWTQYGPTAFSAPVGAAYVRVVTNDPGTPAAAATWHLDEATVTDGITQTFAVQASGRRVVYPVDSGADVHVWQPIILTQ